MEILKGSLVAGLWGYLIPLVLAFLLAMVFISQLPESYARPVIVLLFGGTLGMSFKIGALLVPVAAVLGLVYSIIRRAVREGVAQGSASSPDC